MTVWDAATCARLQKFQESSIDAATDLVRLAYTMLQGGEAVDVGVLLRAYVLGVGGYADVTRYRLRQVTDEVGQRHGLLPAGGSFFEHTWSPQPDAVRRYCPDIAPCLLQARPSLGLEVTHLLDRCPNEAIDLRLPPPLGSLIRLPWRAPLKLYGTTDAIAYIHPFQYQALSKDMSSFWVSAAPRSLSRASIPEMAIEEIAGDIVIIQDRFVFSNLCHFLYDGVTRILHFAAARGNIDNVTFVLGGVRGEYQHLVAIALAEMFKVSPDRFLFPKRAHLLSATGKCFWFSDQVEGHAHPAQMANPRSVQALTEFGATLPAADSSARRLYISRADATRRRIVNEPELLAALRDHGFVSVELARLPPREQIGLLRGADAVVGPHGMGLTQIVMSPNLGRLIELFHPNAGTDAYAFMARTGGVEYDFVIGSEAAGGSGDFTVDVERVVANLGPQDAPRRVPSWRKNANLIPASRTFNGFFGVGASRIEPCAEEMIWGQKAILHRKSGSPEVGRWPYIFVAPGEPYVVSCWVMVPESSSTQGVVLSVEPHCTPGQRRPADLSQHGVWQRIWTVITPMKSDRCWASLNIDDTDDETTVLSTCWQFERGVAPTSYVATG